MPDSVLTQEYGGAPAPTDEDSITFLSFLDSLDKGLVTRVEFISGGEKAYAFIKVSDTKAGIEATRIRIGEGYPEEQSKGWSSPLWLIRALRDRNVRCSGVACYWVIFHLRNRRMNDERFNRFYRVPWYLPEVNAS